MARQLGSLTPLAIVGFALLLPLAYPLSYLALAEPTNLRFAPVLDVSERVAHYRWGGEWAVVFYCPLELLDRWARPEYWDPYSLELVDFDEEYGHLKRDLSSTLHPPTDVSSKSLAAPDARTGAAQEQRSP